MSGDQKQSRLKAKTGYSCRSRSRYAYILNIIYLYDRKSYHDVTHKIPQPSSASSFCVMPRSMDSSRKATYWDDTYIQYCSIETNGNEMNAGAFHNVRAVHPDKTKVKTAPVSLMNNTISRCILVIPTRVYLMYTFHQTDLQNPNCELRVESHHHLNTLCAYRCMVR